MSRPHGRASVDPSSPKAFATCDRCGFWFNHVDLRWQWDYRGFGLANLKILVCENCEDTPQEQLRAIVLQPDPPPIMNARVEPFDVDETDYRVTMDGRVRATMIGNLRIVHDSSQAAPDQFYQNVQGPGQSQLQRLTQNGVQRVTMDGKTRTLSAQGIKVFSSTNPGTARAYS